MRNLKLTLIALLTLALLAACAEKGSVATVAETETPAASPAPSPAETPEAASTAVDEVPAPVTETVAPAPETTPAPQAGSTSSMLPRRSDVAVAPVANDPAKTQRMSITEAYDVMRAGNGVLVDVRNQDAYQFQRIPGALSIPLDQVAARASELPQDKWIITYCTCPAEESSGAAASTLRNMGFDRTAALLGGMQGWRAANLPVEFGN